MEPNRRVPFQLPRLHRSWGPGSRRKVIGYGLRFSLTIPVELSHVSNGLEITLCHKSSFDIQWDPLQSPSIWQAIPSHLIDSTK